MDYDSIKELSLELGRPVETLIALAPINDPFYIGPARTAAAKWFAAIWRQLGIPTRYHYRRIHYRFVSQPEPIKMLDGEPYENTFHCWNVVLCKAARDAIALDLVPQDAFVDNRNNAPIIHLVKPEGASIHIENGWLDLPDLEMPELPSLTLNRPAVPQLYHIEIWAEKTTMNDILGPLAQDYKMNVITGAGELTATACREFVDRAEESGRPVRVLYVSDFDPAGQSMPVAVARKIEFEIDRRGADLDVKLIPVVLTHDQCTEHGLPRTPIKETERRGAAFEARFGAGATELDALEALHPGLLREILVEEIERYWNEDHDDDVDAACADIEERLNEIRSDALTAHRGEIGVLIAKWQEIAGAYRAWVQLSRPVWQVIRAQLEANRPHIDDDDWCQDFDADEHPDPLFDSARDYVDQIDRYKLFQGKPTEAKVRHAICVVCSKPFEAKRSGHLACSLRCNDAVQNAKKRKNGARG